MLMYSMKNNYERLVKQNHKIPFQIKKKDRQEVHDLKRKYESLYVTEHNRREVVKTVQIAEEEKDKRLRDNVAQILSKDLPNPRYES